MLAQLFAQHKEQLRRTIRSRIDHRLLGRLDPSDVLHEAYLEAHRRQAELANAEMPPSVWLRLLTGQKLVDLHRFHIGAQKRSAGREVSLNRGSHPNATTAPIAAHLVARQSSVSHAAMRSELKLRVQQTLSRMAPPDREILALRHFDSLTNAEAAGALGISPNAASNRYVRALGRMKELLAGNPSLVDAF